MGRPARHRTAISNLMLAGDYVRNTMNVATMESACETGKRAAQAILDAAGIRWASPTSSTPPGPSP